MDVIPVLDLMGGQVVRGIAGRRETYEPLKSRLVGSASPIEVARAFRHTLGLNRLYVADLDAIMIDSPQWSLLDTLADDRFELLVDAGIRETTRAERLLTGGVSQVIAALETLPGPQGLSELLQRVGPEHVVFSLDLMKGQPLGRLSAWETDDALTIADRAIGLGATSLIVLDLASVGVDSGVPTHALCRQLHRAHPRLTLISGGGIRERSDLVELSKSGANGALVATALHDGRIGPEDIANVKR